MFRRLLQSDEPLSREDRDALADMLTYTEEHLQVMWDIVVRDELAQAQQVAMTADAVRKIRKGPLPGTR
jgi:Na+/phosphate symporter